MVLPGVWLTSLPSIYRQCSSWLPACGLPFGHSTFYRNAGKGLHLDLEERHFWMMLVVTSLLYLILGAFWFQHWYFLWLLAPAALLPGSRFTLRILPWLCFGGLVANLGSNMINVFLDGRISALLISVIIVGIIWGPGLVAFLIFRSDRKTRASNLVHVFSPSFIFYLSNFGGEPHQPGKPPRPHRQGQTTRGTYPAIPRRSAHRGRW